MFDPVTSLKLITDAAFRAETVKAVEDVKALVTDIEALMARIAAIHAGLAAPTA